MRRVWDAVSWENSHACESVGRLSATGASTMPAASRSIGRLGPCVVVVERLVEREHVLIGGLAAQAQLGHPLENQFLTGKRLASDATQVQSLVRRDSLRCCGRHLQERVGLDVGDEAQQFEGVAKIDYGGSRGCRRVLQGGLTHAHRIDRIQYRIS